MENRVYAQHIASNDTDAVNQSVEWLFGQVPATSRLSAGCRVLVKPNLLSKNAPEKAVTTHPDVLRAVILALQKRGVKNIIVADSPGGAYTPSIMKSVYAACGITAVCEETGVSLYTACESKTRLANGKLVRQFELLAPVLECDFIVNIPKFKTHVLTGISGAVKNLFGCVPGLRKAEFHMRFPEREKFSQMLVDLCETLKADIHIIDGIIGMEGDGPGSGTPRQLGLLLGGENPYTLDLAICHYMGVPPMETPVLATAHENGLCASQLDCSLLVGEAEALQTFENYKPPRSYGGQLNFSQKVPRPLRPLFNRLTSRMAPRPVVLAKRCIGCGKCAEICPQNVIDISNRKAVIHRANCIRCFCCHEICPVKAIDVKSSALFRM